MGTRSLTHIKDETGTTLTTIYRQYDGYPDGHGKDLFEFLKGRKILNGFGGDEDKQHSNGIGCLAAGLIGALKKGIGNVYICSPDSKDMWEDYIYTIYPSEEFDDEPEIFGKRPYRRKIRRPMVKVMSGETVLYDGLADDFTPEKCKQQED